MTPLEEREARLTNALEKDLAWVAEHGTNTKEERIAATIHCEWQSGLSTWESVADPKKG